MIPTNLRRLVRSAWLRPKRAETAKLSQSDTNSKPVEDDGDKVPEPQRRPWPYAALIETRSINLNGETVTMCQWRQDADRSMAFSDDPDFLLAGDIVAGFFSPAIQHIFCGPYPRATGAGCKNFVQVSELVESLGASLLILLPQNLLLLDQGKSLLSLMRRLPDLRVLVYTGSAQIMDMLADETEASRIEFIGLPAHPNDFHLKMAQMFQFELPKWFVEGYRS